jgi:hypothetical protein
VNPIPQSIGPYQIHRVLGEGGTAIVYLAEPQGGPPRAIALKALKSHIAPDSVARFQREVRALAALNHPNIAQIFDFAGQDGHAPYLTMEYVEGEAITPFCDRYRLPLTERLLLFLQVCGAVQYVHQNGVIHRDLKPSNVLASMRDGRPVAKLIDFGLAKLSAEVWEAVGKATETDRVMGTLCYMSPEQARLRDAHVDTRADIYSLGVILYEILAGTPPFEPPRDHAAYAELFRRIREEDPEPPSRRAARAGEVIAAARGTTARALGDALRGDIDWIVAKALDKEPGRRYAAALDLARDIQAHLSDRPVAAGPVAPSYRLWKAMRRNRGAVLAGAALLVALALSTTVGTIGYLRLDAEHQRRVSLLQVVERVQLHTANAHVWFEEKLSGDASVDLDRDVYAALDEAAALLAAVPADQDLAELRREVEALRQRTEQRWKAGAGAGSDLDQAWDEAYRQLQRRAAAVGERFRDLGSVSSGFGRTLLAANAAMLGVLVALAAGTLRFWARGHRNAREEDART